MPSMSRPPKAREPLLAAALRLFVERGIDGTGIREVAREAGVSEAALYRYWASKDILVRELYTEHLIDVVRLMDAAVDGAAGIDEAITRAVIAIYEVFDQDPLVFRFVLLAQADVRLIPAAGVRTPLDVVTDLAQRAAPSDVDHRHLAAAWVGLFLQTAQHVLLGRLPPPLSAHAGPVTLLALRLTARP